MLINEIFLKQQLKTNDRKFSNAISRLFELFNIMKYY